MFHRISLPIRLSMLASKNSTPGKSVKCRARATDLVHRGLIWGPHPVTAGGHLAPDSPLGELEQFEPHHADQAGPETQRHVPGAQRAFWKGDDCLAGELPESSDH